jgi:hypoxanthine phosphoribosyltransferase
VVDDVSVTGQTLELAKKKLRSSTVKTFVLRGKADHVLFPKIKECVKWPWKP